MYNAVSILQLINFTFVKEASNRFLRIAFP